MAKEKGSGRGLDAIFIDNYESEVDSGDRITKLRISEIEPDPTQPRTIFDHKPLEELAESIATHGLLQPITVREGKNGYYTIIAGERRWRASKMAGLSEVPVIIIDADDRKAAELSLIENLQREDLNPIEEAKAYQALIDEYNLTQKEVSSIIGKKRETVANALRLLDLPDDVRELVKSHDLSAGHAKVLLGILNKDLIPEAAKKVVEKGLSVRATEALRDSLNKQDTEKEVLTPPSTVGVEVNYISDLEKRVSTQMGRQFKIHEKGKRKKIEIEYTDDKDLERIIKQLCGTTFFDD